MNAKKKPRASMAARTSRRTVDAPASNGPSSGQPADFAINAKVRQLLARRWVCVDGLEVGTTDGVVVIKGSLEREPGSLTMGSDSDVGDRFVRRLRGELKAIRGVTDVVLEVHPIERGRT